MISSPESQPPSAEVRPKKAASRAPEPRPRRGRKAAHLKLASEPAPESIPSWEQSLDPKTSTSRSSRLSLPAVESSLEPHLESRTQAPRPIEWPVRPQFSRSRKSYQNSDHQPIRPYQPLGRDLPSALRPLTEPAPAPNSPSNPPETSPPTEPSSQRRVVKRRKKRVSPLIYATRWLILIVGFAVISGTLLSILNAFSVAGGEAVSLEATEEPAAVPVNSSPWASTTPLTQELTDLKTEIEGLLTPHPEITPGVFFVDLDGGSYLNLNGDNSYAAASTIKVPVLVAFFQAIDQGSVRLDETLTLTEDVIAEESGEMRYQPIGTTFSALEVATKMITISDNTATNMLIKRLGGSEVLNQQFQIWGLKHTAIRNFLPDLEGTNTTSPMDLVSVMSKVNQDGLVSLKSRDRLFAIMEQTRSQTLLPQGLGEGAVIAHKTGNIDKMLADVGRIDMPNGKRYLLAVMMDHPPELENTARTLIQEISAKVYQKMDAAQ